MFTQEHAREIGLHPFGQKLYVDTYRRSRFTVCLLDGQFRIFVRFQEKFVQRYGFEKSLAAYAFLSDRKVKSLGDKAGGQFGVFPETVYYPRLRRG